MAKKKWMKNANSGELSTEEIQETVHNAVQATTKKGHKVQDEII